MSWNDYEDVGTIDNILSASECAEHILRSEQLGFDAAPIVSPFGEVVNTDVRNNSRTMVDDRDLAGLIWARAAEYVPVFLRGSQAIGMNERFRYYRYHPGQRFDWHADAAFRRANGEMSLLSSIMYLNDDFAGGETVVMDKVIAPRRGMALLFKHELPHEGRPVRSGTKYVLRTDVMYGPVGQVRG